MNVAVALGLCSAVFYGTTDFVSHFATRRSGVLRTMLYGQSALAVALSLGLLLVSRTHHAESSDWAILLASDFGILLATACLYRALAIGNLAIVPPVTACYGAVAALLAIATGETVSFLSFSGLSLSVAGAVLAAIPARRDGSAGSSGSSGASLAAAAAVLYGTGFWAQGRYSVPAFGSYVPVWSYYLLGSFALAVFSTATRADVRPPTASEAPALFGTAALAICGYGTLLLGQATGEIAVVTALSSVASAVTVVLARVFLKQAVSLHGWLGLGAVVIGLGILHLA